MLNMYPFSAMLIEARKKKGLLSKQVAGDTGYHKAAYSLIESGNRKVPAERVARLVEVLDLDPVTARLAYLLQYGTVEVNVPESMEGRRDLILSWMGVSLDDADYASLRHQVVTHG